MEAATEFVQGGDCGNQFTTLLRDVMRAAGADGMEVDERVQELSRLQKMVRDCVLSLMICMLIDDVADSFLIRLELGDDVVVVFIIILLLLLLIIIIAVQTTT
jgi:hypothetical protein